MNILISDDDELDRNSLRRILKKVPEVNIQEVATISDMLYKISTPIDFLFQDISFNRDGKPNSDGLNALQDVMNTNAELPIVIITGYSSEKSKEFNKGFLGEEQIIGFIDKMDYTKEDILHYINKAKEFAIRYEQRANEILEKEKDLEELMEIAYPKNPTNEVSSVSSKKDDNHHLQAFSGTNWKERIEAEAKITGKHCNVNAFFICVEIEKIVNSSFKGDKKANPYFRNKLEWLEKKYTKMTNSLFNDVVRAWNIRNRVAHGRGSATLEDVRKLLNSFERMKEI